MVDFEEEKVEETPVPTPPTTWTQQERDPDTGLIKPPTKEEEQK